MLSDDDTLLDGTTFAEFHKNSMATFNDFRPAYKGTNFDKLIKVLDAGRFVRRQNMDEVTSSHAIVSQHGLQLDNTGDDLGIQRNGVDDDTYKFLLLSRAMVRNSRGTLNDLIRIATNLLGCDPTDIYMKRDRDYNDDGMIIGTPNTIDLVDVPYNKVKNMFLLDRLPAELERAAIGDTRVNFVNLSVPIEQKVFIGVAVSGLTEIDISVPASIEVNTSSKVDVNIGSNVGLTYSIDI